MQIQSSCRPRFSLRQAPLPEQRSGAPFEGMPAADISNDTTFHDKASRPSCQPRISIGSVTCGGYCRSLPRLDGRSGRGHNARGMRRATDHIPLPERAPEKDTLSLRRLRRAGVRQ